jgi:AcrR family transcriptional regulator
VPKAATSRRVGTEGSATRIVILDATEQLMVREGYAAVSTRRVASEAGLTAPLVHYYFPTTDDLLLAVYRRAAERNYARVSEALTSAQPLRALWMLSTDTTHTTLGVEFMALANHRKPIRLEIARNIERSRGLQAEVLARLLADQGQDQSVCPPAGLSLLIAGISRALVMEQALGIAAGHDELRSFVESWLQRLEQPRGPRKRGRKRTG